MDARADDGGSADLDQCVLEIRRGGALSDPQQVLEHRLPATLALLDLGQCPALGFMAQELFDDRPRVGRCCVRTSSTALNSRLRNFSCSLAFAESGAAAALLAIATGAGVARSFASARDARKRAVCSMWPAGFPQVTEPEVQQRKAEHRVVEDDGEHHGRRECLDSAASPTPMEMKM